VLIRWVFFACFFFTHRTAAPCSSSGNAETPKLTLSHYLPLSVKEVFFGASAHSHDVFVPTSAAAYRLVQRVPAIYVYVISTNPTHASELVALFAGIPCLLYKLSAVDFLGGSKIVYAGMGVDRVANMAAAQYLYPSASSVLVIDGGTALTYTAVVPSSSTLQKQQQPQQLGGGIGAGLRMKFRSLVDYTNDLPHITPQQLLKAVKNCATNQQPLPLITTTSTSDDDGDQMMATSMMGCVLTETALLLSSVLRGWLNKQQPPTVGSSNTMPTVVITGGDGEIYEKLLQPKHSYIVETDDANAALLETGLYEDDEAADAASTTNYNNNKRFRLHRHKYLPHHGIQYVLTSKMIVGADMSDDEVVRCQLLGQRVVVPNPVKKNQPVYGTIYTVFRGALLDKDFFSVHYDESNMIDDLGITTIYGTFWHHERRRQLVP
jgi:pantothenate kinase type III